MMPCPPASGIGDVLDDLKGRGVTIVLSLLATEEGERLGVSDEAALCAARGIPFRHFPIADFAVPESEGWSALIAELAACLGNGAGVAVHCRAGIGRSGVAVACLLIALGSDADAAMADASRARGVSVPETVAQAAFVRAFAKMLKGGSRETS